MPNAAFHSRITALALECAGICDTGELAERFCNYPDYVFEENSAESADYMFYLDNIQFHYPPHTPVEEFYRYWRVDNGVARQIFTQDNANRRHVESGFEFYLTKTVELLRAGNRCEAWKFLGCLLHFLEDSTFGIHVFEGANGTDIYALDRLSGMDAARYLCRMPVSEDLWQLRVEPEVFADTVAEAVAVLYRRYAQAGESSRQALFRTALNYICKDNITDAAANEKIMFKNVLQITADTIATAVAIADGSAPRRKERRLCELEPDIYPIGGGGGFRLRHYQQSGNTITFGVNLDAHLLYNIPSGVYREFTAKLQACDVKKAEVSLICNDRVTDSFSISGNAEYDLHITGPSGRCGLRITSDIPQGSVALADGVFLRKQ